jgi:hypothetical protein
VLSFFSFLFQATTAFQEPKLSATFTLQAKADALLGASAGENL